MSTYGGDGKQHRIGFERGVTTQPLKVVGKAAAGETGTLVRWKSDETIFGDAQYDAENISRRLRELAYLNKSVTLSFKNELAEEGEPEKEVFHFERGLAEFVEHLNANKDPLHKPVYIGAARDEIDVEVALQYNLGYTETVLSFANMINTPNGGTHLSGFKTAITRVMNNYARNRALSRRRIPVSAARTTRGTIGGNLRQNTVAAVRIPDQSSPH